MASDEANIIFIATASRDPWYHLCGNDDRSGCVFVTQLRIRDRSFPHELSRTRVQRKNAGISGGSEKFVAVNCDVSLNPSAVCSRGIPLCKAWNRSLFT